MTRVYVALTRVELGRLADRGVLDGGSAFAVTPALRAAYAEAGIDDEEELEYAVMTIAARVSLTRLDLSDPQDRRRIVVAADAEVLEPDPGGGPVEPGGSAHPARVELPSAVPMAGIVSVHLDTDDVLDLVEAAIHALPAAAAGDARAVGVVEALDDEDLAWYATQELADLLTP